VGDKYNDNERTQYYIFGGHIVYGFGMYNPPAAEDFFVKGNDLLHLREVNADEMTRVRKGLILLTAERGNKS
jgi:hypothetical protein